MKRSHLTTVCALLSLVTAGACSGPDADPVDVPESSVRDGQLVHPSVAGLPYETASYSGVTDDQGGFNYTEGETIRFFIGDTVLADVPAEATLNPFQLAGLSAVPSGHAQVKAALYDGDSGDSTGTLSRVGAIASVLATLDEDRDLDNGVVISSAVTKGLDGARIDLEYATNPTWDSGFKRALRVLAAEGALSPRPVRNGRYAVQDAYDLVGVDANYQVSGRSTRANGDVDPHFVRHLTWDPETGKAIGDRIDTDGDGDDDVIVSLSYHEEGYGDTYETDEDGDGDVDTVRQWTLDDFGDVIDYVEFNASYDPDLNKPSFTETRRLSETGQLLYREVVSYRQPENPVHTIETWTEDELGNRVGATIDRDGDGDIDIDIWLTYDGPLGMWTEQVRDTDVDGSADSVWLREYDDEDRLISERRDDDMDGTFENESTWIYDERGLLLERFFNQGGSIMFGQIYTRDAAGRVTSFIQKRDTLVHTEQYYEYDAAGNRIAYEYITINGGGRHEQYAYEYDADGNRTATREDKDNNGSFETVVLNTYDALGQPTRATVDRSADTDPGVDRESVWTYDDEGYPLTFEADEGYDGTLDKLETYSDYIQVSVANGV